MPAYTRKNHHRNRYQQDFLLPCLFVRFRGLIRRIDEPCDSKQCVGLDNNYYVVMSNGSNIRNTIRNTALAFRVLTKYINHVLSEKYLYLGSRKGFLYDVPIIKDGLSIVVYGTELLLNVYRTFRTSYYLTNNEDYKTFRLFISIGAKFEILPDLGIILQKFRENYKSETLKAFLDDISDMELSTIKDYWMNNIGPPGAGILKKVIFEDEKEYNEHYDRIIDYYKKKGSKEFEFIKNTLIGQERPPIVLTEKYHKGELKPNHYFSNLLVLTPNYDALSQWLDGKTLDLVRKMVYPSSKAKLWEVYSKYLNEVREILVSQNVFEVGDC